MKIAISAFFPLHMSETFAIREAIDDQVQEFLDKIMFDLKNLRHPDATTLRDWIQGMEIHDGNAMNLSLEDQLHLAIEYLGDLDLEGVLLTNFWEWIEQQACVSIHLQGESRALEWLNELEEFLDENELDLRTVTSTDPYERVPVHRVRDQNGTTVYEYWLEEEVFAEVWEFHHQLMTVFASQFPGCWERGSAFENERGKDV